MNKKRFTGLLTIAAAALVLSSCQVAPVNATTTINSTSGAGSKTISALVLVDGSCQIAPDKTAFEGNNDYFYIEDADFSDITFEPKYDDFGNVARVKMVQDGYLTNPNGKETTQEVWDEFNQVVESYVPEGFEFKCTEVKSANWDDKYMDEIPTSNDVTEWKGYVYSVTYSWDSVEDYMAKTKTLVGHVYDDSHLKELDDLGTPWASISKNDDGTYTWKEAYLVNFWSVYGIADNVMESEYFNRAALGADFTVTTEQAFSVALQEYTMGEKTTLVKIDNKNGVDDQLNPKFIEITGTLPEENNGNSNNGWLIGVGVLAVAVVAVGAYVVISKKKKAA